jgi:AGCS family alanine or glycine:cation symporter
MKWDAIPLAFEIIFYWAFNPPAVEGGVMGGLIGIGFNEAMRHGVARGVFSNESGLGSAPMAHATAKTDEPVREGLVALMEPFIDTIISCTLTGLVIVIAGISLMGMTNVTDWGTFILAKIRPENISGPDLSVFAFQSILGQAGAWAVALGLIFFAYATIISWSYYGDRSAEFLFGERAIQPYRIVYTILVFVGAVVPVKLVWNLSDITNIFMAIPNLISLWLLAGMVKRLLDEYMISHKQGKQV